MSLEYTPISELEATNAILYTLGETPTDTLDPDGLTLISLAQRTLHATSREVQSLRLHCNTEENYPLTPGEDGYINIPPNVLFIDASDNSIDVVQRGSKLYNRTDHTYLFTAEKELEVDITFFLPFSDLTQVARRYITIKAARQFQVRALGSEIIDKLTEVEEKIAWYALQNEELYSPDYNYLNNNSIQRILKRY